jgi:hypothetical protein
MRTFPTTDYRFADISIYFRDRQVLHLYERLTYELPNLERSITEGRDNVMVTQLGTQVSPFIPQCLHTDTEMCEAGQRSQSCKTAGYKRPQDSHQGLHPDVQPSYSRERKGRAWIQ